MPKTFPMEWLAVCAVVLVTLASGYYSFFMKPPEELIREDGAAKWEERMQPVRSFLPSTVREVGYLSDGDSTALIQEYAFTQYALVPIVVHRGSQYEWIIGNFTQPGFENILREQIPSAYTIKKFGAGIYVIHRTLP